MSPLKYAPTDFFGIFRQLGPGLIVSASIVGSGELIATTSLGGEVGFKLLWFIILGCLVKVFIQIELGRYAITHGKTTLEAINSVPGPKVLVSWMVWVWIVMFIATFFQLAGIVGGIAGVFRVAGSDWSNTVWAGIITGTCAILLVIGRYRMVETMSTLMVALFTFFTIFAVFGLSNTPYAITMENVKSGLTFAMPDSFSTAFVVFGLIGVGASELIYYPYWCLEKGYASFVGPYDGTYEWRERAIGWMRILKYDAWFSMAIYTSATIAFYLLGAAVIHGKELVVGNDNLIPTLSLLYEESLGQIGLWVFLIGAFVVLFSTVFIATASNGRLFVDILRLFKIVDVSTEKKRMLVIRIACVLLPALYFLFYWRIPSPKTLVFVGGFAQATMLPLLAGAALFFAYRRTDAALKPGKIFVSFLWLGAIMMATVGIFQAYSVIQSRMTQPVPVEQSQDAAPVATGEQPP